MKPTAVSLVGNVALATFRKRVLAISEVLHGPLMLSSAECVVLLLLMPPRCVSTGFLPSVSQVVFLVQ